MKFKVPPSTWILVAAAALAPVAVISVWRAADAIPAVALAWCAAVAAWRIWGARHAWAAGLMAAVGAHALHIPTPLAAFLAGALLVAAWWPRFGPVAVGGALLGAGPLPLAAAALATGALAALMPARLSAPRQGNAAFLLRAALLLGVAALLAFSFLARLASLDTALGAVGLASLGFACVVASLAAVRAQDGTRLAWSLAPAVVWPFAAARLLQVPLRPALAVAVVVAAVQVPVILALLTRGMRRVPAYGAAAGTAVALAGAVAMLAR